MKIKLILLFTILLTICSCTHPDTFVEDGKVAIDMGSQQLIPYQKDQKINFIHSKGYAFDFTVIQNDLIWDSLSNEDKHPVFNPQTIHYTAYQTKKVVLQADYPEMTINLLLRSDPTESNFIHLDINSLCATNIFFDKTYKFVPNGMYGESSIVHDSLVINGKTYNNVVEANIDNDYYKSVLYNNEQGLLQIKLSDNETFTINN